MLAKSDFRTLHEEKSSDELRKRLVSEISALTVPDLRRLRKFARWRILGLGHLAAGREHSDLLQEAIVLTLDGRRRWIPENVTFIDHLLGAMRSISYAWSQKGMTEARILPADDAETDEDGGTALLPFYNIPAREPSPERQAEATETIRTIMDCFREDDTALKILTAMMEGQTNAEIVTSLGITHLEYHAARKRIQRRLQKRFEPQSVSEKRRRAASEVP
jgi:hypothetical protein